MVAIMRLYDTMSDFPQARRRHALWVVRVRRGVGEPGHDRGSLMREKGRRADWRRRKPGLLRARLPPAGPTGVVPRRRPLADALG